MNFQPNRTFIFQLGTRHFFYRNGYQYETKPQTNGGRGYAELLFFPTAEGYVKAVYSENLSEHEPAFYKYVYLYKDHLGNTRLSYTLDNETNQVTILEENNYYPFGLKHGGYNTTKKDISYISQVADGTIIQEILPEQVKFKYYYQEQERQDELGLNWDSFKYRNYDYAIGRFMSVDPLAEKYAYNSTYAFQENKLGLGRELEGKELDLSSWLINDAVAHSNGVGAHVAGFAQGVINSVKETYNAITHPVHTLKGMANVAVAGVANGNIPRMISMDNTLGTNSFGTTLAMTQGIVNGGDAILKGNGFQRGETLGNIAGTIAIGKGTGEVLKGASILIKANTSIKVFRVYGGDAKANGYSWTPKDPRTIFNFRDKAGLPSGGTSGSINTAEFLIRGKVKNKYIIQKRTALPLDGNKGGLPEYIIDPKNVKVIDILKMNQK